MGAGDMIRALQIRDGAGDLEHPVIAPGGQPHLLHRLPEEPLSRLVRAGDLFQEIAVGLGVGADGMVA